jgi:uncharacterized membrane protein
LAIPLIVFGVEHFLYQGILPSLTLLPEWLPAHALWAYLTGAILIAAGISIAIGRLVRPAAIALGILFFVSLLIYAVPRNVAAPLDIGERTVLFETMVLFAAALLLAGGLPARFGRYLVALSMAVFGIDHFFVDQYVASVIPAWIPWHMFWVYFTAAAFFAAALAIATRKLLRPAALALALMFFSWVVLVHAPRIATHLGSQDERNSGLIALAMTGAALIVTERAS